MFLSARVLRTIREHALTRGGDRLAVALSGGPDSVGLLWLLRELEEAGTLAATLAGVIHVNHQLRGDASMADEAFCRALAERLHLPIEVISVDVASLARRSRRSIEATARDVRYTCFDEAAARLGATVVATGHTLDDQAETVLLRLLRGTGTRGLGAIRVRLGRVIRPLLQVRRADLRRYLTARGEASCDDASNQDLSVLRNKVRHLLLPVIDQIAPSGIRALARLAAVAAADEAWLEQESIKSAAAVVLVDKDGVQLNTETLRTLPAAIGRRVVRRALESVARAGFSAAHLDALLRMARAGATVHHLDLPGVAVDRRARVLSLTPVAARQTLRRPPPFEVALPVPGRADVLAAGFSVTAERHDDARSIEMASAGTVAVLQGPALQGPLTVRSRRPGDRLRPLGAPGRRKLQDLLVDRKVPRAERDRLAVVADDTGRIVWVAGVAIAEECRVTAPGASVLVLRLEKVGTR